MFQVNIDTVVNLGCLVQVLLVQSVRDIPILVVQVDEKLVDLLGQACLETVKDLEISLHHTGVDLLHSLKGECIFLFFLNLPYLQKSLVEIGVCCGYKLIFTLQGKRQVTYAVPRFCCVSLSEVVHFLLLIVFLIYHIYLQNLIQADFQM